MMRVELIKHIGHAFARILVEIPGGLISEEHSRVPYERARQYNALLLAP